MCLYLFAFACICLNPPPLSRPAFLSVAFQAPSIIAIPPTPDRGPNPHLLEKKAWGSKNPPAGTSLHFLEESLEFGALNIASTVLRGRNFTEFRPSIGDKILEFSGIDNTVLSTKNANIGFTGAGPRRVSASSCKTSVSQECYSKFMRFKLCWTCI